MTNSLFIYISLYLLSQYTYFLFVSKSTIFVENIMQFNSSFSTFLKCSSGLSTKSWEKSSFELAVEFSY